MNDSAMNSFCPNSLNGLNGSTGSRRSARASALLLGSLLPFATAIAASAPAPPRPAPAAAAEPGDPTEAAAPPLPASALRAAQPFVLETAFDSDWSAERPAVRSGWLLVVEFERSQLRPRQTAERVAFVGREVAERLNVGFVSGRLVLLVPAELDEQGSVRPLGEDDPIFLGSALLPEQVDAVMAEREWARARGAGLAGPSGEAFSAVQENGATLRLSDREALLNHAGALVRSWAPDELDRADQLQGIPVERVASPIAAP